MAGNAGLTFLPRDIVAPQYARVAAQPRLAWIQGTCLANLARRTANLSDRLAIQSGRTIEAETAGLTFLPKFFVTLVNSRLASQSRAAWMAGNAGLPFLAGIVVALLHYRVAAQVRIARAES